MSTHPVKHRATASKSPAVRKPVELPSDPVALEQWLLVALGRALDEGPHAQRLGR